MFGLRMLAVKKSRKRSDALPLGSGVMIPSAWPFPPVASAVSSNLIPMSAPPCFCFRPLDGEYADRRSDMASVAGEFHDGLRAAAFIRRA